MRRILPKRESLVLEGLDSADRSMLDIRNLILTYVALRASSCLPIQV